MKLLYLTYTWHKLTTWWYSTYVVFAFSYCFAGRPLPSSSAYSFPEAELNAKNINPEEGYEKWNLKYNYYCITYLTWVVLMKSLGIFFSINEQVLICYNKHLSWCIWTIDALCISEQYWPCVFWCSEHLMTLIPVSTSSKEAGSLASRTKHVLSHFLALRPICKMTLW